MLISNWWNSITVYEFEGVYDPTYLNLDKTDRDSWKVFAEKVRDCIAGVLQIPKVDMDYKDTKVFGVGYFHEIELLKN